MKRREHRKYRSYLLDIAQKSASMCAFCHYEAKNAFDVFHIINVDGDYSNNAPDNHILACDFCAYSQLLDLALLSQYNHSLILLPNMSQADLNRKYQYFRDLIAKGENIFEVKEALNELESLSKQVEQVVQIKTDFKDYLGLLFNKPAAGDDFLCAIRWLPGYDFLQHFNWS